MKGSVRKGGIDGGGKGIRLVPGLAVRAGQTIAGKYRVEELLGSGASGVVISARNIHLREPVVLKILASYTEGQEELLQRRLEKARLASRLQGTHVARIVDIGVTDDDMPYVASECLQGTTLEVELEERGPLPIEEAARWVLEACEGLAEAHAMGLVHGDLKPQNIFLAQPRARARSRSRDTSREDAEAGADPRVLKILDFGTTSPLDGIGDQSASAFFGSPAFLAPEQIQNASSVDARADIWALGVMLYNLVSGSLPFAADTVSGVIVAVVYDAPSLLTEAPYPLAKLVASCLEKDPAKRPQDVKELAEALARFAGPSGAYLSERVAAMLDAPPVLDADASGSLEPVSVSPSPDPPPRAPSAPRANDQTTRPSRRVVASRRVRWRKALGLFAMVASVAALGWRASHAARGSDAAPTEASMTTLTNQELVMPASSAPVVTTAYVAANGGDPPVSFAPSALLPAVPTPLAITATPLATAESDVRPEATPTTTPAALPNAPGSIPPRTTTPAALPNAKDAPAAPPLPVPPGAARPVASPHPWKAPTPAPRPPVHAPQAARVVTAPPASRLPAGLPSSREPSGREVAGASGPRSAAPQPPPRSNAPAPPSASTDASYLRSLFSERK